MILGGDLGSAAACLGPYTEDVARSIMHHLHLMSMKKGGHWSY